MGLKNWEENILTESFVSRKDRIIASAIEIISESGLSALTTKNLAMKENMSETLLYKYFGSINEVLVEVVEYYVKFDKSIQKTVLSKKVTYTEKIRMYVEAYASYYDSYYAISTLMLQYEELLHNIDTRDEVAKCIQERHDFLKELFEGAIKNKEIIDVLTPDELADDVTGIAMIHILNRRITIKKQSFKQELCGHLEKVLKIIRLK